ncbi:MAG: ABC transporter permease [Alphaproteobacteria bacterium]|nr:ABC transporter permease [Alphaproteobacteria bacterium]MDA8004389.1 ABC transporter permease [Alphaproteobacteria bacterium]MDA8006198.1 ABC transporter permease [Alphaproteobacteria bacterium]MDA8013837.1 ABC transporter permease [Alphaproteobacteria bacterium]
MSPFARLLRAFLLLRESPVGIVGLAILVFWLFIALLADVFVALGWIFPPLVSVVPLATPGTEIILGAGATIGEIPVEDICGLITGGENDGMYHCGRHWLGSDHIGRDILSRVIFGARTVIIFAPLATFCAYVVGIPMGLIAGYRGGWFDEVLSFIANMILSFPVLVLYILILTILETSVYNILLAVTFASSPGIFRIVRGVALDLRSREYVAAAQTRGEPMWRILLIEILPNARGPLLVDSMLRIGYTTIQIGILGFLGLGLPPPTPDWGGMVNDTRQMLLIFPHMAVFPCIAISTFVLGFNLLADGMREVSLRD